ncbi:MAG: hypothetical protein GY863_23190, partial [bacterium]|nr:hypothetical protein [bacterium]
MKRTRRDFIKKGLISTAGVSVIPNLIKPDIKGYNPLARQNRIIHRTLGNSGIKVPIVGMGMYDNTSLLPHAHEIGLTFVLSSGDYRYGNAERRIGDFVSSKPRDSFVVVTGFDPRKFLDNRTLKFRKNATSDVIIKFAEESLDRLKLEYIDIYNICNLASKDAVLYEPFLQAVGELKRSGKIRFVGAAT